MRYLSLILLFILECEVNVYCQNSRSARSEQLYSQISSIKKVPSAEIGDSIYWAIVKGGLDNMPFLIELLDSSQMTNIHVPYFGRDYSIGDIDLFSFVYGNMDIQRGGISGNLVFYWLEVW
ncbi:hypothetical protein [uncultured Bacteroides sp.]|uniref:hypothetical protein n=1 Tax=uncultured Bacteroides sp. TaxID=162156 RepID=UPI0025E9C7C1|nr:hypothetical protein [uncultured Bacteroides sp.]